MPVHCGVGLLPRSEELTLRAALPTLDTVAALVCC